MPLKMQVEYATMFDELIMSMEVRMLNTNEDRWIGIEDASEYLDVNKDTIRNWIKKEESGIPAHKIGKQWKFKKSELDDWVKSGKSAIE